MSGYTASGSRQQAACTSLYADTIATTASYADVTFTDGRNNEIVAIPSGFAVSLVVEAEAETQAINIKILQRAHSSATWRELQAETGVATSGVTEVYADIVRAAEVKVQIKEGASSGGVGKVSLCLK